MWSLLLFTLLTYQLVNGDENCERNSCKALAYQERTFVAIKPDGVHRGLVGKIIQRFEDRGYKLVALKQVFATKDHLQVHYEEHDGKPFFEGLIDYMASGPVVAMIWQGVDVVKQGRKMLGATNPQLAAPGTIRGDYALEAGKNICHASDSTDSAKREIAHWFNSHDINDFDTPLRDLWLHE